MAFEDFFRKTAKIVKKGVRRGVASSHTRVLYYPGCLTEFKLEKVARNYKSMLNDAGIRFFVLPELVCCGSPLLSAGYAEDFEEVKEKNISILKKNKVSKIVSNCPHCVKVFKEKYGLDAEHISKTLDEAGYEPGYEAGAFSYHDPCLLVNDGVINEPRNLLKKKGLTLNEPLLCKEKTFCCGAGNGLKQNSDSISGKVAVDRLKQLKSRNVVSSCPYCYLHLKEHAKDDPKTAEKQVFEMSEVLFDE
ncbi:(Fe-S)-binding protein [Candidatus Woesearchaeota archaeon]|nr:(Fe-S)-binding protein [Candidatus Woesearchaeota archaeon]